MVETIRNIAYPIFSSSDIVSQISMRCRNTFSADIIAQIYTDKPVKDVEYPYIFIQTVQESVVPEMRSRYKWTGIYDIRIHPKPDALNKETWLQSLFLPLLGGITRINVQNQFPRILDSELKIIDQVLHCLVTYSFMIAEIPGEQTKMQILDYSGGIK